MFRLVVTLEDVLVCAVRWICLGRMYCDVFGSLPPRVDCFEYFWSGWLTLCNNVYCVLGRPSIRFLMIYLIFKECGCMSCVWDSVWIDEKQMWMICKQIWDCKCAKVNLWRALKVIHLVRQGVVAMVFIKSIWHDVGCLTERFKDIFMIKRFFSHQFYYSLCCQKTVGLLAAYFVSSEIISG